MCNSLIRFVLYVFSFVIPSPHFCFLQPQEAEDVGAGVDQELEAEGSTVDLEAAVEQLLTLPTRISKCLQKGIFHSTPSWKLRLANFSSQAIPQVQLIIETLTN